MIKYKRKKGPERCIKYPFASMKVGETFDIVPDEKAGDPNRAAVNRVRARASIFKFGTKLNFTTYWSDKDQCYQCKRIV